MSWADKFNLLNGLVILRLTVALHFIPHVIGKFTEPATLGFFKAAKFNPPHVWMYTAGAIETDENETTVGQFASGLFFGTLRLTASTQIQAPAVKEGNVLLAYPAAAGAPFTLYDVQGTQLPVAFTAADGTPIQFNPQFSAFPTPFGFDSRVSNDAGFLSVDPAGTPEMDILSFDFVHHFVTRITNTPAFNEYPFN